MTPEQHDQMIDLLFKRINLRGEAVVAQLTGEGAEGSGRGERGGWSGKKIVEHANPFQVKPGGPDTKSHS